MLAKALSRGLLLPTFLNVLHFPSMMGPLPYADSVRDPPDWTVISPGRRLGDPASRRNSLERLIVIVRRIDEWYTRSWRPSCHS
jgi:hypothetical protein